MNHKNSSPLIMCILVLAFLSLSCQITSGLPVSPTATIPGPSPSPLPSPSPTPLPAIPVQPGDENPDEPVFITGEIPYTSRFFLNTISEPFVMLEDLTGFRRRDRDFEFPLVSQVIGPVEVHEDGTITYEIALPSVPQGTNMDLDNDSQSDEGVQVFAVAYWSNTWNGPFLEPRDGTGWSNAYTTAITDPENNDEIIGGTLVVWAPDDEQSFPSGFGADGLLFTEDDPIMPVPAGYSIIDLDQEPFRHYKTARPTIPLIEGEGALNDLSELGYTDAFERLFEKVSREYPFTQEKQIDWDSLYEKYAPRIADTQDEDEFYLAMRDFAFEIPDAHVNISLRPDIFYSERGGGFGLVAAELSDGRIIVTQVIPDSPADDAGIQAGAQIITWDDQPVDEAITNVVPDFGPYSTEHHRRLEQLAFLTRVPPGETVRVRYQNPGEAGATETRLEAIPEYDSLFLSLPIFTEDGLSLPIQGEVLQPSGLGYLRISTFSEDYSLLASTWEYFIDQLIDDEIPGLIIDLRQNSGGSGPLALDFAGYFFDQVIPLFDETYYNENSGEFESKNDPEAIKPAPKLYDKPIAVLVSPNCASACEGFAYALAQLGRSAIVGHYPTAGAFGEVGRGQYELPDDISMQFPTGRPIAPDGRVVIEGKGVIPDILVPVTEESALNKQDVLLQAAVDALLDRISK